MVNEDLLPSTPPIWAPHLGSARVVLAPPPPGALGLLLSTVLSLVNAPLLPALVALVGFRPGPVQRHGLLLHPVLVLLSALPLLSWGAALYAALQVTTLSAAALFSLGLALWALAVTVQALLLQHLLWPGTDLHKSLGQSARACILLAWSLAALSGLLPDMLWAWSDTPLASPLWLRALLVIYALSIVLGATLLPTHLYRQLQRLQPPLCATTHPTIRADLAERLQCTVEPTPLGLRLRGSQEGATYRVIYDEAHAPPCLLVEIHDPCLSAKLCLRDVRDAADIPNLIDDPLLRGVVSLSGVSPEVGASLLRDAHEEVLSVFHAHPSARLLDQRLQFHRIGGYDDVDALVRGIGLALEVGLRLVALLRERAPDTSPLPSADRHAHHEVTR